MTITNNGDTFNYNEGGTQRTAELVGSVPVDPSTGQPRAPGRAAASSSSPVALSNEDKASLDAAKSGYTTVNGTYVNNTARAAGTGIIASITTGGTATLTFGGVDIAFTFAVGPTILPLAVTKTALGTAVGAFYAIS